MAAAASATPILEDAGTYSHSSSGDNCVGIGIRREKNGLQLAKIDMHNVSLGNEGNADVALGTTLIARRTTIRESAG